MKNNDDDQFSRLYGFGMSCMYVIPKRWRKGLFVIHFLRAMRIACDAPSWRHPPMAHHSHKVTANLLRRSKEYEYSSHHQHVLTEAMGSGRGDNRARYRAVSASLNPATTTSLNPSPPLSANNTSIAPADARHACNEHLGASYDNEKAAERKVRRRRQPSSSIYFLPCLGAAVAVLILVLDVKWTAQERSTRRRAAAAARKTNVTATASASATAVSGGDTAAVGSLGKTSRGSKAALPQQGAYVADANGATPADSSIDTDISNRLHAARIISHPSEVSVDDLGLIDGREALLVGNRFRSHTDSQGRTLSWWTKSRRYHDNYSSDLNFDVPLDITFLDAENFRRRKQYEEQPLVPPLDLDARADPPEENFDQYEELMDDDAVISKLFTRKNENRQCRQPDWYGLQFPTCNSFHEMTMVHSESDSAYLGKGFFRMAFSIKEKNQPWFILKVMRWRKDGPGMFSRGFREKTRVDGLVMERLSSSPRITDMYGFCATSLMTEPLPGEIWGEAVPTKRTIQKNELRDKKHLDPKNKYTPTEKIEMALDLAEALAELHGFADGMIVHDDIDLGQYLRTPDGRIKLNDFNRAKIQLWDPVQKKYCKYYNGYIGGKMRAPEEFVPDILDSSIDIFSLGNSFYGLLTGLWPHYYDDNETAQQKVMRGIMPYIDKRWRDNSFAESQLVRAIEMCHHREPDDRSDIFTIVNFLREAVAENRRREIRYNQL